MNLIKVRMENNIALLNIDRPEALNALNRQVIDEIDEALEEINKDKSVMALVIYGENNFAAGADVKAMAHMDPKQAYDFSFAPTMHKLKKLSIPSIAAIEGYALGGGLELALACDLRIASENARMGFPEINLGIMPGAGGTIMASRMIGEARAKELIFTGRTLDGAEAERIGLVNKCTDEGQALNEAVKLAEKLCCKARTALVAAKESIACGLSEGSVKEALEKERSIWSGLFDTYEQKEGMRAFIEKRKPDYSKKED